MQSKLKNLESILAITIGFLVLYLIFGSGWFLAVSVFVGFAGLVSDWLANKIVFAWTKLSEIIGGIMSKIILGAVFFFILTPIAFIYRLSGKDPLQLKNRGAGSIFTIRDQKYSAADLENMW